MELLLAGTLTDPSPLQLLVHVSRRMWHKGSLSVVLAWYCRIMKPTGFGPLVPGCKVMKKSIENSPGCTECYWNSSIYATFGGPLSRVS